MSMRELVSGGAACAVPGSSSSSNPVGALANALIGSSSKTQERLKEIPNSTTTASSAPGGGFYREDDHLRVLPGAELDHSFAHHPTAQGSEFLRGFRSADQKGLADAWNDTKF